MKLKKHPILILLMVLGLITLVMQVITIDKIERLTPETTAPWPYNTTPGTETTTTALFDSTLTVPPGDGVPPKSRIRLPGEGTLPSAEPGRAGEVFLTTQGKLLKYGAQTVVLRGVNFDNISAAYGSFDGGWEPRNAPSASPHNNADYALLASYGANHVRLGIWYGWYASNPTTFFAYLDQQFSYARANGIWITLNLFTAPTSNGVGCYEGYSFYCSMWNNQSEKDMLRNFWVAVASRYTNEVALASYDLLNEPTPPAGCGSQWFPLAQTVRNAVLAVDPNHLVTIMACSDAGFYSKFNGSNIIYEVHHYSPMGLTHASWGGGGSYPGTFSGWCGGVQGSNYYNKAAFESTTACTGYGESISYNWSLANDVPLYIGEWGVQAVASGHTQWVQDNAEVITARGINHAYYTWEHGDAGLQWGLFSTGGSTYEGAKLTAARISFTGSYQPNFGGPPPSTTSTTSTSSTTTTTIFGATTTSSTTPPTTIGGLAQTVQHVMSAALTDNGGTSGFTFTLSGVQEDDLIIVGVETSNGDSVATPSDMTLVGSRIPAATYRPRLTVFSKWATGGETSISVPTGYIGKAGVASVYRTVDRSAPIVTSSAADADGTSLTLPSVTAATAGNMLALVAGTESFPAAVTGVAPSGMTKQAEAAVGYISAHIFTQSLSSSGASGTKTVTWTGSTGGSTVGMMLLLKSSTTGTATTTTTSTTSTTTTTPASTTTVPGATTTTIPPSIVPSSSTTTTIGVGTGRSVTLSAYVDANANGVRDSGEVVMRRTNWRLVNANTQAVLYRGQLNGTDVLQNLPVNVPVALKWYPPLSATTSAYVVLPITGRVSASIGGCCPRTA